MPTQNKEPGRTSSPRVREKSPLKADDQAERLSAHQVPFKQINLGHLPRFLQTATSLEL